MPKTLQSITASDGFATEDIIINEFKKHNKKLYKSIGLTTTNISVKKPYRKKSDIQIIEHFPTNNIDIIYNIQIKKFKDKRNSIDRRQVDAKFPIRTQDNCNQFMSLFRYDRKLSEILRKFSGQSNYPIKKYGTDILSEDEKVYLNNTLTFDVCKNLIRKLLIGDDYKYMPDGIITVKLVDGNLFYKYTNIRNVLNLLYTNINVKLQPKTIQLVNNNIVYIQRKGGDKGKISATDIQTKFNANWLHSKNNDEEQQLF